MACRFPSDGLNGVYWSPRSTGRSSENRSQSGRVKRVGVRHPYRPMLWMIEVGRRRQSKEEMDTVALEMKKFYKREDRDSSEEREIEQG